MNFKKLRLIRKICHHYKTDNLKCVFFGHKWLADPIRNAETGELIEENCSCSRCRVPLKSYYYAK